MMIRHLSALALLGLASCGNQASQGASQFDMIRGAVTAMAAGPAEVVNMRTSLTREQIDQSPTSLMLAEIPKHGGQAIIVPILENGNRLTWGSSDGITVTLQDGLLISTRGLGGDLFGANASQTRAILTRGGTSQRVHDLITSDESVNQKVFNCEVTIEGRETIEVFGRTHATTKVNEVCRGTDVAWQNSYWIEAGGVIRKSIQWVSRDVEYIFLERLD